MDWLKKHYEKILLASTLVLLIVSAAILWSKVGSLSEEALQASGRIKPIGKSAKPTPIDPITNALAKAAQPPLWTSDPVSMFGSGLSASTQSGTDNPLPPTSDTNFPVLVKITREPFNLLFMTYTGEGHNFGLNFLSLRTFYVDQVGDKIADRYGDTGYVIKKFNLKKVMTYDPNLGTNTEKDISELTLQHGDEDPIILVRGQIREGRESVAWVLCTSGVQPQPVRRDQIFQCAGKSYKVIDISSTQMIIVDEKSGERIVRSLPASRY